MRTGRRRLRGEQWGRSKVGLHKQYAVSLLCISMMITRHDVQHNCVSITFQHAAMRADYLSRVHKTCQAYVHQVGLSVNTTRGEFDPLARRCCVARCSHLSPTYCTVSMHVKSRMAVKPVGQSVTTRVFFPSRSLLMRQLLHFGSSQQLSVLLLPSPIRAEATPRLETPPSSSTPSGSSSTSRSTPRRTSSAPCSSSSRTRCSLLSLLCARRIID